MVTKQRTEELIASLERSVEAGLAYFQGPGAASRARIGAWRPREVLAHLLFWHQATAEGMESVLAGGKPYRAYASVDEMNARAVGRTAAMSMQQLVDQVRHWQARLVAAARKLPDPSAIVLIRGDGTELSAERRLEIIAHHWDEHLKELQARS